MAVFSRITAGFVLACIATSSLLATPAAADQAVGARHLKHPQPRAAHHHAPATNHTKGSKRAANKKQACAAKSSTTLTTTSHTSTSSAPAKTSNKSSNNGGSNAKANTKTTTTVSTGGSAGSGSGNKAGLGWTSGEVDYIHTFLGDNSKVSWCYTWSPWPCCSGSGCPESVPMLWGPKQLGDWNPGVYGNPSHVLGFNEPDQSGESAMSVGEACSLWNQHIAGMSARKVSPAPTSSPAGLAWIKQFMQQCGGSVDVVAIHHYGMDAQQFISMIQTLHATVNKPIWVTEWACQNYGGYKTSAQCTPSQISSFMSQTQGFLDGADYVERYAWFAPIEDWSYAPGFNTQNGLLTNKQPNALGWQYISKN